MPEFNLPNLDPETRTYMVSELDADIADGSLAGSRDFNSRGKAEYPGVMRPALTQGNIDSLAGALRPEFFNPTRTDKNGKTTQLNLADSALKFAGGEFNRFYLRGLCLRAQAAGIAELVVYRARQSTNPRPESEAMIGRRLPVADLLADLRENKGTGTYLGVPMGPHSGLSARLP